ncbi:Apoptosis-inducing factor-A-like protein [Hordeum vulgare]|nr:Apoptosis-inducing factor-A-like protein [Hordeum vulgare]
MAEAGKPRVVVVGGGIDGALLAKTMDPDADILLLDPIAHISASAFLEIKQGYLAQKHSVYGVAKNLKLLIKGSPPSKLATYSTGDHLPGRKEGLAQLPYLTLASEQARHL